MATNKKKDYEETLAFVKSTRSNSSLYEYSVKEESGSVSRETATNLKELEAFINNRFSEMTARHSRLVVRCELDDISFDSNSDIIVAGSNYVNVPLEKSAVDVLEAELGERDIVYKIEPAGSAEDVRKVKPNSIVMDRLYKEDRTSEKMKSFRLHFLKYGIGVVHEGLDTKKRKVKGDRTKKFDGAFLSGPTSKFVEVIDTHLGSRVVHPTSFLIDDGVIDFSDANDCIEMETLSKTDVIAKFNTENFFNVARMVNGLRDTDNIVKHYYNVLRDIYAIMVNDVLVYEGPNPYPHKRLPYSVAVMSKSDKHPYGKGGVVKTLKFAKPFINEIFNITISRAKRSNMPPILMGGGVDFDGGEPFFDTGAIRKLTGSVNEVREMKVSPPDGSMFSIIDTMMDIVVRVLWIDLRRIYTKSTKTKFEAGLIEEAKNKRISNYGKTLDYAYRSMLEMRLKNAHYFMTVSAVEDIVDPSAKKIKKGGYKKIVLKDMEVNKLDDGTYDFNEVPGAYAEFEMNPKAIEGDFSISVVTESTKPILKEIRKDDVLKVTDEIMKIAQLNPEAVSDINWKGLTDILFETYGVDKRAVKPDTKSSRIAKEIETLKAKAIEAMKQSGVARMAERRKRSMLNAARPAEDGSSPVAPEAVPPEAVPPEGMPPEGMPVA